MDVWVIITAAGSSTRMGALGNKLALQIEGQSVIRKSVRAFVEAGLSNIVVVVPPSDYASYENLLSQESVIFAPGGRTRQESVYNGMQVLPDSCTYVLIHDGARPFVSVALIKRVISQTRMSKACIPMVALSDTIYETENGMLSGLLVRDKLGAVQTPQGFAADIIKMAHEHARITGLTATDDAALVKLLGHSVAIVEGEYSNTKITRPEDMVGLEAAAEYRVGFGFDVHRLVEERPLILAGVDIPSPIGLLGHSDADVIVHAVMDALLGALGLGDIGLHFPDTDECYKGVSSLVLLAHVKGLIEANHALIENIDVTLLLERPKIAPYKEAMRDNIASVLGIPKAKVNIKATTNEGLGYVGAREGAACYAVASVRVPISQ